MDWLLSKVLEKVESIVSQVAESGIRLLVGVKEDVDKLCSTFRTIQAVLEDAEKRQVKEKAVRIWLDKFRSIAYDMEDVLDEWNTAILKSQIQLDASSSSSMVRSLIQPPSMSIARLVQHRDIADKIKELNERLQAILKEIDDFAFLVDLTRKNNDLETERPKTTYFVDASEIRGRDEDKDTLISLLLSEKIPRERGIPLISIVGMGGIGKTTLAQVVYNHHEVTAYFQQKIWVCVSDPFDEMRIATAILESLTSTASGLSELNSVLKKIRESIVGKEYLLVLDDLWNEDERKWQSLKYCLQSGSQGSKILVTTRKENVATMMGCTKLFHLGKLSQEECCSLFSQIALSGRNNRERESLEDIGKKIAARCQGLPLAAKTLGGLLRFKKSREQWQRILDSPMWQMDETEEGLFSPLLLSYYDLPSPLRQCFSYCAIFPKDYRIKRDLLIKYWMAQGFLGEGSDMEILGEEYFDNLAARSFFQEFEKDEDDDSIIIRFKMHDIVHDFAQLLRKSECCIVLASSEEQGADRYHKNVRHLRLIGDDYDVRIPDPIYNVKRLRSLIIDGYRLESWPESVNQLTCLRKLDLRRSSIRVLPPEIGSLIHLRYFSLKRSWRLVELPEALCDLCNLQTLNIRRCHTLKNLPHGIEKLINLRHLQNAGTFAFIPKEMQRLTCLRTLELLKLEKKGGNESETSFRLADLGNLIHLREYLWIEGLGNVGKAEVSEAREAPLSTKARLRELILKFNGGDDKEPQSRIEDEASVLQALEPPQQLQKLSILECKGPAFPFPIWMMSLTSLKSVDLWNCDNWDSLPSMGKLPYLESLYIFYMKEVKKVGEEFLGLETSTSSSASSVNHNNIIAFPNLKKLKFFHMEGWEEWEYDEKLLRSEGGDDSSSSSSNITTITIMPKLQLLHMEDCPRLKTLPRHMLQSRALQELNITNCPVLKIRFNKETGEDWPSISHIPDVYVW